MMTPGPGMAIVWVEASEDTYVRVGLVGVDTRYVPAIELASSESSDAIEDLAVDEEYYQPGKDNSCHSKAQSIQVLFEEGPVLVTEHEVPKL
jgi:hypothetical protein